MVITPSVPLWVVIVVSVLMVVNTILWFGIVATFFTNVRLRKMFMKYKTMMNRVV